MGKTAFDRTGEEEGIPGTTPTPAPWSRPRARRSSGYRGRDSDQSDPIRRFAAQPIPARRCTNAPLAWINNTVHSKPRLTWVSLIPEANRASTVSPHPMEDVIVNMF